MAGVGVGPTELAAAAGVNLKTVQRWLGGRLPHPRHRWAVAEALQCQEVDLWPQVARGTIGHEVHGAYPTRAAVPVSVWAEVIRKAGTRVCLLDDHGLYILEHPQLRALLAERLRAGVQLVACLAAPRSRDGGDPARELFDVQVRLGLQRLRQLQASAPSHQPGVEVRLYSSRPGVSLLRTDGDLLVSQSLPEIWAVEGPTLHLRLPPGGCAHAAGSLGGAYLDAWQVTWTTASRTDFNSR